MSTDPRIPRAVPAQPVSYQPQQHASPSLPEFRPPRRRRRRHGPSLFALAAVAMVLGTIPLAVWLGARSLWPGQAAPAMSREPSPAAEAAPPLRLAVSVPAPEPPPSTALEGMRGTREELLAAISGVMGAPPELEREHGNSATWRWPDSGKLIGVKLVVRDLDDGYAVELSTRLDGSRVGGPPLIEARDQGLECQRVMLRLVLGDMPQLLMQDWNARMGALTCRERRVRVGQLDVKYGAGLNGPLHAWDLWTRIGPTERTPAALDQ